MENSFIGEIFFQLNQDELEKFFFLFSSKATWTSIESERAAVAQKKFTTTMAENFPLPERSIDWNYFLPSTENFYVCFDDAMEKKRGNK